VQYLPLRGGIPPFSPGGLSECLKLKSTKSFPNGAVQLTYERSAAKQPSEIKTA